MKKVLEMIAVGACLGFIVWVGISYIDILAHNLSGGTDHVWNFFILAFK